MESKANVIISMKGGADSILSLPSDQIRLLKWLGSYGYLNDDLRINYLEEVEEDKSSTEKRTKVILSMEDYDDSELSLTSGQVNLLKWLDSNGYLYDELNVEFVNENEWEEI